MQCGCGCGCDDFLSPGLTRIHSSHGAQLEQHAQHYIDEIDDAADAGEERPDRLYYNEEEFARG